MNKDFVQDAAYKANSILNAAHRIVIDWREMVLVQGRNPDPEVVAATLDHTASKLMEHARIIRAEAAKHREAA
jgi:hypothetical protein